MTYAYTLPNPKRRMIKPAIAVFAVAVLTTIAFNIAAPKSKPTPLATQPTAFEQTFAPNTQKPALRVPEALTYAGIDSKIRNVQIDNAHLGHKLKMAMISDNNPVKRAYIAIDRKFSVMAILVGLAFLFTLFQLGFIRTKQADLENY